MKKATDGWPTESSERPVVERRLSAFWRTFLVLAVIWNLWAGAQMLLNQPALLGDYATAGLPRLYLFILGELLLLLGGVTALILIDSRRYWPLAWFAGVGRTGAGTTMLYHAVQGSVAEHVAIPGSVDVLFGVLFFVFAFRAAKWSRPE